MYVMMMMCITHELMSILILVANLFYYYIFFALKNVFFKWIEKHGHGTYIAYEKHLDLSSLDLVGIWSSRSCPVVAGY